MRAIKLAGAAFAVLGLAACNTALPSGAMVERGPGFLPPPPPPIYAPPPMAYAPPPPRRCFFRDGPYGPERVCRTYY